MKDLNKTKEQKDSEIASSSALAQIGNMNRRPVLKPTPEQYSIYQSLVAKQRRGG